MITMPYATATATILAAAAFGALSVWALSGAETDPRVSVLRAQRWLSLMSHPSIPKLSMMDSFFAATVTRLAQARNGVRVRLALSRSRRLVDQVRRTHVGTHRLDPATRPVQRRFAGRAAGWIARHHAPHARPAVPALAALPASPIAALPAAAVAPAAEVPLASPITGAPEAPVDVAFRAATEPFQTRLVSAVDLVAMQIDVPMIAAPPVLVSDLKIPVLPAVPDLPAAPFTPAPALVSTVELPAITAATDTEVLTVVESIVDDAPVAVPGPVSVIDPLLALEAMLDGRDDRPEAIAVIESSPDAFRQIRTHRPTRNRRPTTPLRIGASRPSLPRQRGPRQSRLLEDAW